MVLLLHIALAAALTRAEVRIKKPVLMLGFVLLMIWAGVNYRGAFLNQVPGRTSTFEHYLFLRERTDQYNVVLSDLESSWITPTFGGKVVAAKNPLAFVPNQSTRREDLNLFFEESSRCEDWQAIIEKYGVDFLLINSDYVSASSPLRQSTEILGEAVYSNEKLTLIQLVKDFSCPLDEELR